MDTKHLTKRTPGFETQISRAEQTLRASELSYRRLFEAAKDGILILDVDTGRITDVNRFLVKLLGFSHSEMMGKTVGELSPFKDVVSNQAMLEQLQKEGYVRYEDLPLETKDGRKIAVEFVSNVYQAGEKKVIQCNIRDITERKRSEEALQLLGSAVEQTRESILITDAELGPPGPKIIFVNPAFTQITGYTAAEVIGKSPRILQGPRTDKSVMRRLRQNLERGEPFAGEAINYRKDGKPFDMEWQITPLRNAGGKVTHFVATQRDITLRKKLEEQSRQAQKMDAIGHLAGGVAHDFNNILSTVQMQADLMLFDGNLSTEQLESIAEISASVRRATALTRQLLLFSRHEMFQPADLDLNETIATTAKMLKRMLGETIEMQLKLAPQPLFLHGDAGMLDQVLMNLCVNARDAMPQGGHLLIETSGVELDELAVAQSGQARPGSFVRLSVSDCGCGIAPEILPQIFEPFFTTKAVGKGTGLGLATVFGIVQRHQGWINVYSEAGHGTTFRIYLPRLAGNARPKSASPAPAEMRGGTETILLAEDAPALRVAVRKALSQLGYRILEAPTGVKAVEIWQENRDEISLLLTDLVMPDGMTGKELGQRLLHENPKLRVVYMSGYSAEFVGKDFPLEEDFNFLTKPFPAQKLAETIRRRLDARP